MANSDPKSLTEVLYRYVADQFLFYWERYAGFHWKYFEDKQSSINKARAFDRQLFRKCMVYNLDVDVNKLSPVKKISVPDSLTFGEFGLFEKNSKHLHIYVLLKNEKSLHTALTLNQQTPGDEKTQSTLTFNNRTVYIAPYYTEINKSAIFTMAAANVEEDDVRANVEEDDIPAAVGSELNTKSDTPDTALIQNENPAECSNCSVLDLNQDCLLNIFSYLSMKNLLSVEKVCPQFKSAAELSWRRFTMFDCTRSFHRYLDETFKKSLIRCGPYLKKIYFPPLLHDGKATELLGLIAKHCRNIECAVLTETQFKKPYMKNFTRILSRLKCLEIEDNEFELTYYILKQLFKKVSQLKYLTFRGYHSKDPDLIAKAFQFLPKTVTTINFGHLSYPNFDFFSLLRVRCPNLEVLTMSAEPDSDTGPEIAKFTKLNQLEIYYCEMKIETMNPLLTLHLLEKLVLSCPMVMDDEFLENVAKSMPLLKHLDVHAAIERDVTDKGIEKLAQLKNLEHLNLSYYNLITHKGIGAVAANGKLKELILISTLVTDEVISAVLNHCFELKHLDLSSCCEITEESANKLLEIFTTTNNRAKLTVIVGGTEYVKSELLKDEEEEGDNLTDLYATNLTILRNNNYITSKIRRRYGGIFDDDSDDFDDEFDDEFDEYDEWYGSQDDFSDYEYQLDNGDVEEAMWGLGYPYLHNFYQPQEYDDDGDEWNL